MESLVCLKQCDTDNSNSCLIILYEKYLYNLNIGNKDFIIELRIQSFLSFDAIQKLH